MVSTMRVLAPCLAMVAAVGMSMPAHAHSAHGGHGSPTHEQLPDPSSVAAPHGVTVKACWIRALPSRLPSAGYFQIANSSGNDVVLVGAQAEGFGKVMLHAHEDRGGMAAMAHVDQVVVPARGRFDFAPRGHHLMLEQPDGELQIGSTRELTLWFEGQRAVTTKCEIRPPGTLK